DPDQPMIDPVELQILAGALRAIAEEMGAVLIRSAHSANIKERRDASTALFDAAGEMVMQAEHIPVHLGAMPAALEAVRDEQHAPARTGARRLLELHQRIGAQKLAAAFEEVLGYAERRTRACLSELDDGTRTARDVLEAREGDLPIALRASVEGDELTLDFTG